jgi:uncharacterized protein (TIGR02231 family)
MMFNISFLFLLLSLIPARADEIAPRFKINSVVVYTDQALISKVAVFKVKQGESVVKVSKLTPMLVDGSVQVEITKGSGVKILDVKVVETFLEGAEVEKAKRLRAKLDSLNKLLSEKAGKVEVIAGKIEQLKKLSPPGQRFTVQEVESYFKFYERMLAENVNERTKLQGEIEKLNEEKKRIEDELRSLTSVKEKSKSIEIYLMSERDEEMGLRVSYVVYGANWVPGYEVRVSSGGKVDLSFFAFVRQLTGEDWGSDVDIEISTARVSVSGTPPEISQWIVDVYQPRPIKPFLKREEPAVEKAETPEIEFLAPEVEIEPTSFSFKLRQKLEIPSDDQQHRVFISSFSESVPFVYYAVPKISRYAYLQTKLKNEFAFPILPGKVNVFIDGKYVSSSSFNKILPGDSFDVSFGVDEAVRVERKLKRKFTEYTGLVGKNVKISYEYEIEVQNGKGREISIEVRDNFPISRNEKIKVVLESPRGEEAQIGDDGIIRWRFNLPVGGKKILSVKFYVEFPKDLKVVGLE